MKWVEGTEKCQEYVPRYDFNVRQIVPSQRSRGSEILTSQCKVDPIVA